MLDVRRAYVRLTDALSGRRVVFHHVPKCGGTSISRALRWRYPLSFGRFATAPAYLAIEALNPDLNAQRILDLTVDFRQKMLLLYLFRDVRCVAGHVRFVEKAYEIFGTKYVFVTTLREPVSLMTSIFHYDKARDEGRWKIDYELEAFLDTPRAAAFGSMYARFFCGLPLEDDARSAAAVERAKRNLESFALVGRLENMDAFRHRLSEMLGIRLSIGHQNRSRVDKTERVRSLTATVRRKIEALSGPNADIYQYVCDSLA